MNVQMANKVVNKTIVYFLLNRLTRKAIDNMGTLNSVEGGIKTRTIFDEIKSSILQPTVPDTK